ncbi:type IV toxin-antitoxin system AbiEi family antitoxin domain-containing protein [Arthrobacter sp. FW305-BF8]|uniref:type IV toxin-antitoxin system AbiEi family antitoxin domain-containing protein n=1 Tax=Arthrobacter sp. FW305-BF8 TaxID=2879617 RepID=UPI001F32C243|nr:type IV toxin-antitoxin system AbiEi family antitoxin domain-containing protein [Arthrobacter sp. FW305-BF8]UKA55007.1 type IV toxin-antitoxin system AbiEi family antitoxin domain-containing protein [Arthrobacter sp. FW305-BF8]
MRYSVPGLPVAEDLWRTDQLLQCGLNSRAIAQLVRDGTLVRVRRGCYARGGWWTGLSAGARRRQLIHAHAHGTRTTSAGGFVYSHTSGASLQRLHLWGVDHAVHLTQAGNPSGVSHGHGVVAHTRRLSSREVTFVDDLPCTSLERTVVDCCLMFNVRQSVILVDHAARQGADLHLLRDYCTALVGRNGVVALRRALELVDPRSESAGESLTRELIHRLRIPAPELQYVVRTPLGEHRLDFAWPAQRVALEFDGKTKYFDYRPTGEVVFQERRREKALMEQGWIFVRVEWKDLFREQEFKFRLLRALAQGSEGPQLGPFRRFPAG